MKFLFRVFISLVIITAMVLLYEKYNRNGFVKMIEEDPFYDEDNIAGHIHSPHFLNEFPWEEHAKKFVTFSTNNLGFRESKDTKIQKEKNTIRVFVTGDSHTDGVVNNNESFCNLLEDTLNKTNSNCKFEFLNAGTGFYSFKNYYGAVKKNTYLQNDVVVICVYPGNDFIENIIYDDNRTFLISDFKLFWYRIRKFCFNRTTGLASTQHINQLLFFKMYPAYKEKTINISINYLKQIKKHCDSLNIQLLTVLLPTELNVDHTKLDQLKEMDWDDESININENLKNQLKQRLEQQKFTVLDLSNTEKNNPQLFWKADQHLSVKGHQKISELIFEKFEWGKLVCKQK